MASIGIFLFAVVAGGIVLVVSRVRQCQHRFGVPVHGTVCCMKCTRRFAIEAMPDGAWRIARTPLREAPATHREHS